MSSGISSNSDNARCSWHFAFVPTGDITRRGKEGSILSPRPRLRAGRAARSSQATLRFSSSRRFHIWSVPAPAGLRAFRRAGCRSGGFAPVSLPLFQGNRLRGVRVAFTCPAWSYSSVTEEESMCHWLRHWNQVSFRGITDSDPAQR
jgi:hypothetical protein